MKPSIIYVSYTGTIRGIAERIQKNCGGTLLEVRAPDSGRMDKQPKNKNRVSECKGWDLNPRTPAFFSSV